MPEYTELFEIEYEGEISDLEDALKDVPGVTGVGSFSDPSHREVDKKVQVELTYDSYETDRTSICAYIDRDIDGATNAISA